MRTAAKLALSIIAALAGSALVVVYTRDRATRLEFVDRSHSLELATLVRRMEPRGLGVPEPGVVPSERVRLDEATARLIFTIGPDSAFDEYAGFRFASHLERWFPMADVPGGGWLRKTNGAGLREDGECFVDRPDVFVLVAGDSHTEGVCANAQSYANVLEARIAASRPGESVEVLNTGTAGYTLYNELGMLERYAEFEPQVFVTAIFAGNDFTEQLPLHRYFHREDVGQRDMAMWRRLEPLRATGTNALGQGIYSLAYFSAHPEEVDVAVRAMLETCVQIRDVCNARGISWIVVWIPSAFERRLAHQRTDIDALLAAASLSPADRSFEMALSDRTIFGLQNLGVPVVDMREHFADDGQPWYWSDFHVNVRAHAKIAEVLEPLVNLRLRERPR